jgi:hypothetical protein
MDVNSRVKVRGNWGTWLVVKITRGPRGDFCEVIPLDHEAEREGRHRLTVPIDAVSVA